MDEEEEAAGHIRQAAVGLEQGLETCHRIVSDYRSKLLSLEQSTDTAGEAPSLDNGGKL